MNRHIEQRRFVKLIECGTLALAAGVGALGPARADLSALGSCDVFGSAATSGYSQRGLQQSAVYPDAQFTQHKAILNLNVEGTAPYGLLAFNWSINELTYANVDAADKHWRVDEVTYVLEAPHQAPLGFFPISLEHFNPLCWSGVPASATPLSDWLELQSVPPFSSFQITNPLGAFLDRGDVHVDPKDPAQLVLSFPRELFPLPYRVVWRPVSVAVRTSNGRVTFGPPS